MFPLPTGRFFLAPKNIALFGLGLLLIQHVLTLFYRNDVQYFIMPLAIVILLGISIDFLLNARTNAPHLAIATLLLFIWPINPVTTGASDIIGNWYRSIIAAIILAYLVYQWHTFMQFPANTISTPIDVAYVYLIFEILSAFIALVGHLATLFLQGIVPSIATLTAVIVPGGVAIGAFVALHRKHYGALLIPFILAGIDAVGRLFDIVMSFAFHSPLLYLPDSILFIFYLAVTVLTGSYWLSQQLGS